MLLIAIFESAMIWPEGLLRISPYVAVRAFMQPMGEENAAMEDVDGGKDGNDRRDVSD